MITLGACGSNESTAPSIDATNLDVGNYSTTPLDVETLRKPSSGAVREAIRIGDITPIPFEYDSRFAFGLDYPRSQIITPDEPPYPDEFGIDLKREQFTTEFPGLVAGWRTHATRRLNSGMGRNIDTYTVRFDSTDSARNAVDKMGRLAPGDTHPVDGYPQAIAKVIPPESENSAKISTWLAHEDMVLIVHITDPVSRPLDLRDNTELVRKFYSSQIQRLQTYSRTALAAISQLPLDFDGMLSRTFPAEKATSKIAAYPAHVALSQMQMPVPASAAFTDAGVDVVVQSGAIVYRAKDAAGAERLSAAFANGVLSAGQPTGEAAPPPNLPSASCSPAGPDRSQPPTCRFTVGRYLVRIAGANLQDTYQRVGAQYRLLADHD
ncbi:hypothetical protein [Nocardia sp. NPDC050718]|uniref:DUF7373 family lipoprotein n=1 Tax=Nocardia sp. NPDC050718 TaxID=3155788 RepID=UPI0033D697B8